MKNFLLGFRTNNCVSSATIATAPAATHFSRMLFGTIIMYPNHCDCYQIYTNSHLQQKIESIVERDQDHTKRDMTSPLISVHEGESVKDAVLLMRRKHIRRLAVKKADGEMMGTVTLMSIVGNAPSDSVDLADIEPPSNVPGSG